MLKQFFMGCIKHACVHALKAMSPFNVCLLLIQLFMGCIKRTCVTALKAMFQFIVKDGNGVAVLISIR